MGPWCLLAEAKADWMAASSVMSTVCQVRFSWFSNGVAGDLMSRAETRHPAARKADTMTVPMWPAAPVMTTWVPSSPRDMSIVA